VPRPQEFVENCTSSLDIREALQRSIAINLNSTVAPDDVTVFCSFGQRLGKRRARMRRRLAGNVTIEYEIVVPVEEIHSIQNIATALMSSSNASSIDLDSFATIISAELSSSVPGTSSNAPTGVFGGSAATAEINTHSPTPAPTPAPTLAPTLGPVSGIGDPHLTNIYGERYDLYRTGVNVLLRIPSTSYRKGRMLLRMEAESRHIGTECSETYFQIVKISGPWTNRSGTLKVFAKKSEGTPNQMKWRRFGKIELKVAHGKTGEGVEYLNVFAKHLGRAGFPVGGLLGGDDHTEAASRPSNCARVLSL